VITDHAAIVDVQESVHGIPSCFQLSQVTHLGDCVETLTVVMGHATSCPASLVFRPVMEL
jgi:hypothetical protein